MPDDEVRDAVDKVADPNRLLEGEDPETTDAREALRWLSAYAELLEFKQNVVGEAEASAGELSQRAQQEAEADLTLLNAERERLKQRYAFWKARVVELSERRA